MTCLTELACSMHADGALGPEEAAAADRHLRACAACRARLAALTEERVLLEAALSHDEAPVRAPAFRGAARGPGALAAAGLLTVLGIAPLVAAEFAATLGVGRLLAWLDPIATAALVDLGVAAGFTLLNRGNQLMTAVIETAGSAVVLALLAWAAFVMLRQRGGAALLACAALGAVVLPRPGEALEVRRSEGLVSVPAGETVDDTLLAFGDRVEIDGTVTGDVYAFARRIVVRGTVEGQLVTFSRTVGVDGQVGSGMIGFAQSLEIGRGSITRNLIGFAQDVRTYADGRVGENAVLFGQNLELAGPIERDVLGYASEIDVRSTVGGSLTGHSARLAVLPPASIGGDVVAHVPHEDALEIASGATIGGTVSTEIEDAQVPEARFTALGFYFGQAVRLAAAFLTGLILLALVPSLRRASIDDGGQALAAAGLGLVTLVAAPIIAVIVAVTVIGLPVAIVGVLVWLVSLYLAKIVLAHFVGRRLFEATEQQKHFALALLLGLLLVIVAVNLPFVGGIVNFVLTITGLGMLVIWLWHVVQGSPTDGARPAVA